MRGRDAVVVGVVSAVLTLLLPSSSPAAAVSVRPDRLLEVDGEPLFPIGLLDLGAWYYPDWNERIRSTGANVVWDPGVAYENFSPRCRDVADSARAAGYRLLLGSRDTIEFDDPGTPELEVDVRMYEEPELDALLRCVAGEPDVLLGFANRDEPVWTIAGNRIGDIDAEHIHDTYRQLHSRVPSTLIAMNFAPVNISLDYDTWKAEILPFLDATDVVMHASYPYPPGPGTCIPENVLGYPECAMDRLADNADLFLAEINRPDQPLWMIVQAFKDIPRKEARWEAYAAVIHGATGILWAGWTWEHELGDGKDGWPVTVSVMSELSSLHGFLVGEDVAGAETGHPDVEVRVKRHRSGDEAVALAISRHGFRGRATIRLPGLASGEVTLVKEDRTLPAQNGWIADDFDAYEAHGYRYRFDPDFVALPGVNPFPLRAFPTPSSGVVHAEFTLPAGGRVVLRVYDAAGRSLASVGPRLFPPGPGEIVWDGRDAAGTPVVPGVYFLRVEGSGQRSATARALIRR